VFTRNQIIEAAQGDDTSVTARSVDVHMVSLRRKLGPYGEAVETIRGVGYRFKDSEE
jgi:two-component system phosphate regulon response regulator PhoB